MHNERYGENNIIYRYAYYNSGERTRMRKWTKYPTSNQICTHVRRYEYICMWTVHMNPS